jgi:IPT/TIG domain
MTQPAPIPTPYTTFQVAGLRFPVPADVDLYSADPVLAYALDFWQWVIERYVGEYLLAAAKSVPLDNGSPLFEQPIVQVFPDDPGPYLGSQQMRFPMLAAYRKNTKFAKHSAGFHDDKVAFDVMWVLPPVDATQASSLLPARRAIEAALRNKTVFSFDPEYAPKGGKLGDSPWGLSFAGVEEIGFESSSYVAMPGTGNLVFPAIVLSGFFLERDAPVRGPKFAGGDVNASLLASDGTSNPNVVQLATQQAPTVSSLSVTSGTMAGGTNVTFFGSLFLPGSGLQIYFGPTLATNIAWTNAGQISCTTPAASGSGSVSVTVKNRDGQSVTVPNAWTYTSP